MIMKKLNLTCLAAFFCIAFLFCAVNIKAQSTTSLPVTINKQTGGGNIALPWITFANSSSTWHIRSQDGIDCGYQLNMTSSTSGSMVFAFSDVPTNAVITIHRFRDAATVFNYWPQVIFEASSDNQTWRQIGVINDESSGAIVYHIDNTVNVSFLSTDRFLRITKTNTRSQYAYLKSITIDGYTPTEIGATLPAGNHNLNLPCFATDIIARIWGGGGGGGGANNSCGNSSGGGGGGGGAYAIKNFGDGGGTMSVTVGTGGAGGTGTAGTVGSGNNGTKGNDSKCTYNSILVEARGGGGGSHGRYICSGSTSNQWGAGGAGGTAENGGLGSLNGQSGWIDGQNTSGGSAGNGGGITTNGSNNTNGITGTFPGGGGSGARRGGGTSIGTNNGGAGREGSAKITFDITVPNITITNNNPLIFCEGGNTTLIAATCADTYISYQWYKGDVRLDNETNSTITITESGDYYVEATLNITLTQLRTIIGSNLLNLPGGVSSLTRAKFSDVVTVTVNPKPVVLDQEETICSGDDVNITPDASLTYSYIGIIDATSISLTNVTSSQVLSVTPKNAETGCIGEPFNVNIIVNQPTEYTINASICAGETYHLNDVDYTEAFNGYAFTTTNATNCDSVVYLNLTIKQPTEHIINALICADDAYYCELTNSTYTEAGLHTLLTLQNAAGCDSVIKLNLTIISDEIIIANKNIDACHNEEFDFLGLDFSGYLLPQNTTFTILFDGEEIDTSNPQIIENPYSSDFTVTYDVIAEYCGTSTTFEIAVTVKPIPQEISGFIAELKQEGDEHINEPHIKLHWSADANAVGYILSVYDAHPNAGGIYEDHSEVVVTMPPYIIMGDFDFEDDDFSLHVKVITHYGCEEKSEPFIASLAAFSGTVSDNKPFVDNTLKVWTNNGNLYLNSKENQTVSIFTVVGINVATLQINADQTLNIALPRGIYILHSSNKAIKVVL